MVSVTQKDASISGKWVVEWIYDRPVIDHSPASFEFGPEQRLTGNASCNNYFGMYAIDGSSLTLHPIGKTSKMCIADALMEQEARFMDALPDVTVYEVRDGILFLKNAGGATVFRAVKHAPT
jgi:heat shock protein HslJ